MGTQIGGDRLRAENGNVSIYAAAAADGRVKGAQQLCTRAAGMGLRGFSVPRKERSREPPA